VYFVTDEGLSGACARESAIYLVGSPKRVLALGQSFLTRRYSRHFSPATFMRLSFPVFFTALLKFIFDFVCIIRYIYGIAARPCILFLY
jgi:hypothetical protein